jgi:hypothetical protein
MLVPPITTAAITSSSKPIPTWPVWTTDVLPTKTIEATPTSAPVSVSCICVANGPSESSGLDATASLTSWPTSICSKPSAAL